MRKSRISFFSAVRLAAQRSLSRGGWTQFVMPLFIFLLAWLLFAGVLYALLRMGVLPEGDLSHFRTNLEDKSLPGIAFYHLFTTGGVDQLPGGYGWVITLIGIVLVALLTSFFTNFFNEVAGDYREGRSNFRFTNHIAVFGFDDAVPCMLRQLLSGEYASCWFLVLTSGNVNEARAKLMNVLTPRQLRRVVIIRGDICSAESVRRMQVGRAQEILIPGEGGGDGQALDCLNLIAPNVPEGMNTPCFVRFNYRATNATFQLADINEDISKHLFFVPFNVYDLWAHEIFVGHSAVPVEGEEPIGVHSSDHVHLVVAGMNNAAVAIGLEALRLAHYPNGRRSRLSFICKGAEVEMNRLKAAYPGLFGLARTRLCRCGVSGTEWLLPEGTEHLGGDFLDVEIEFIDADISNPSVRGYLREIASDDSVRLTAAVCLDSQEASLNEAVSLPPEVFESASQVLVYQPEGGSVASALAQGATVTALPFHKLKPFGSTASGFDLSLLKDLLKEARSLHIDTSNGNLASKSSAAQLWSDVYSACHIRTKQRSACGDFQEARDALAKAEHNRWNVDQLLMNFRPLTKEEQEEVLSGGSVDTQMKGALKRTRRAHLDICSWSRLEEIDPEVIDYDYHMVDAAEQLR